MVPSFTTICFSKATLSSSSTAKRFLFLVITALHSSLGFFSMFTPKLLDDFSANCLASWPTWISRLIRQVCEVLILICSLSQFVGLASHPLSAPLLRLSARKNLEEG
ncbi:hypothetical protein GmHk_19G054455 [Glycine max]|nr:hypothetical protein GmHk_19G054455 [Glycine max]